ncbi:phage tail assembly protein [Rhodoplanes serenus]|uniref:Phage tail assembly protein n=1 Tax=Rhodoplanes serenus TaxID=200615 RepID=A0A9X4XQI0_9BRAD|nr:phage tail assembly protein [Rhodoplanes serenus]MTW16631.1 phage tail assembly protein [Rhodoplanes serenus]
MTADYDKRHSAEVALDFPIEIDGTTYNKLTMRRLKTRDSLKAAEYRGSDAKRGVLLLADLCDVSPDVIEELDDVDFQKLDQQLARFRGGQSAN